MIQPPIIVNENGDLSFFESVRRAEEYLEPIDVKNNEYSVYDGIGNRLDLIVMSETGSICFGLFSIQREIVKIAQANSTLEKMGDLEIILRKYVLERVLPGQDVSQLTLADLITEIVRRFGFT